MPTILILGVVALGVFALSKLGPKKRQPSRVVVDGGGPAAIPSVFESESQARAYFLEHAGRIAATGDLASIDVAMLAMRELGISNSDAYDALASAAAQSAPLLDPWAEPEPPAWTR